MAKADERVVERAPEKGTLPRFSPLRPFVNPKCEHRVSRPRVAFLLGPGRGATFVEHIIREHIEADLGGDGGAPVSGANERDLL